MRNRNVLFLATCFEGWKGGLYYVKNMLYGLLQYEKTQNFLQIYVLVEKEDEELFLPFQRNYTNVTIILNRHDILSNIRKKIRKMKYNRIGESVVWDLSDGIMEKYKIDVVFPLRKSDLCYNKKGISWIPDFQYYHYPKFFEKSEIQAREKNNLGLAKNHFKLILSSEDAYKDYRTIYSQYDRNVYVVPFVSAIEFQKMAAEQFQKLRVRLGIPSRYFIVSNQFWKHKNHEMVFRAVNLLKQKYNISVNIVCTGKLKNDRNSEYDKQLLDYIAGNKLENQIYIAGLIPRDEQLQLMSRSVAVIQPSLFEGWGTVVEDAKTLNKQIIMSDIAVHYEQMVEGCVLFEQSNIEDLAIKMYELWNATGRIEELKYDVNEYAVKYGKRFFDIIMND